MLLDLLTFQEKIEIWNFIQISKLLNMISNLKREKSKPNKTHRTVGWTQCMGCQCAVPALFDTRGAESHTALAYFTFHLAGCDFLSSLQTRLPLTQFWLGGPPLPGVSWTGTLLYVAVLNNSYQQMQRFPKARMNRHQRELVIDLSDCPSFSTPFFLLPGRCMFAMAISPFISKCFHGPGKSIMDQTWEYANAPRLW